MTSDVTSIVQPTVNSVVLDSLSWILAGKIIYKKTIPVFFIDITYFITYLEDIKSV